jgi:MFS family permease
MTTAERQRWVLALTSTASLMISLDALVVTTALHAIAVDLHASIADLEWTVNAYTLSFAVLLMAGAALGERYGRRRILIGGLALFGIASAGCALAPGLGWLIATRTIQGAGTALVSAAAFGLVWGLIRGNESGWASAEVVAALAGGAVALVVFIGWELRTDTPLIPMRFFATRAFSAGNAAGFLLFACIFSGAFFFAQFLQIVLRHGPVATGLLLAPWTGALFVVAPVAGKQVNRIGARPLVVAGLLLQAVGFGWIALIAGPGLTYPPLILPLMISGAGLSMAIPSAQSAVIGAVPMAAIGAASGTFNTVRQLGGAFGIAITTAVFTAQGGLGSAKTFSEGFAPAIATAAALAFAGAVIGLLLPRRAARNTRDPVAVPAARQASVR